MERTLEIRATAAAEGSLPALATCFGERMIASGYAPASLKLATRLVRGFATWLDQREISGRNIELGLVDEYLADRFAHQWPRRGEAFTLREFIGHVSVDDAAAAKQPIAAAPAVQMRRKFEHYLLHERGLAPASIRLYGDAVERFLEHVFAAGEVRLGELIAADVVRFVQLDAARLQHPKRAKVMTSALRSFLQYGRYLGEIHIDLRASVPTVANWSMTGIPRSISPSQVDSLLARCDRQFAGGRRDYAVLLLLARLGDNAAWCLTLCAAAISPAASCMLSTTGNVRGSFTGCIRAINSTRPSVMSKKNSKPVNVALSVMGEGAGVNQMQLNAHRLP